jgi:uncharacterized protein
MIIDVDRHVAADDYRPVLEHMELSWRKHFERTEFLNSIVESSNHIRVTDRFGLAPVSSEPAPDVDTSLLVPHQALAINAWADHVAATVFVSAFNEYARETWGDERNKPVIVVSSANPAWSGDEIRRRAAEGGYGAVAVPLGPILLGSNHYDPIYQAASETGLAVVAHYSGAEGLYAGAASLGGGVHKSAFSRKVLLPQLAESNITSLAFEGAFERFPDLRLLFSGFGFTWLPALLWRMDREWRTFRYDIPWVKRVPSEYVMESVWASTWPIVESTSDGEWARHFDQAALISRVVYGSHAPFDGDPVAALTEHLGADDAATVLGNGEQLLPRVPAVHP